MLHEKGHRLTDVLFRDLIHRGPDSPDPLRRCAPKNQKVRQKLPGFFRFILIEGAPPPQTFEKSDSRFFVLIHWGPDSPDPLRRPAASERSVFYLSRSNDLIINNLVNI
jgi:hypothetical protein